MNDNRTLAAALLYMAALAACLIVPCLGGCEMARRIDDAIWSANPAEVAAGLPAQPAAPGQAPPIVEGLAAVLAAVGFGGLGKWIHSTRKAANGSITEIRDRLAALETDKADRDGV